MRRNTKIVATYGPAVDSPEKTAALVRAGVDVVRLNFSHGSFEQHAAAIEKIRAAATRAGRVVAILQDLRGPKIRVGDLADGPIQLAQGEQIAIVGRPGPGEDGPREAVPAGAIPVEGYATLSQDVEVGEKVLLNDGVLRLRVAEIRGEEVVCDIEVGGELSSRKGVNLPDTHLQSIETITEKDWRDLEFGLSQGVDWVALSFVRSAADVNMLKEGIAKHGADTPVIAKIEKSEALERLDEIVAAADGIMVARGDLGVETELEEVVLRQKEIIRTCNREGKVVITATQMLESMIEHATPTRAEVADISNAIFDGTDALMLSGETAVGKYPIESVSFMARIAEHVEEALDTDELLARRPFLPEVSDAVAHAACMTAHEIGAKALICLTRSGLTARLVSRYRPSCPVIAVSPEMTTVRRLAVHWGVLAVSSPGDLEGELLLDSALFRARATKLVGKGDTIVLTAGVSTGSLKGKTNLVRVEVLG